MANIIGGSCHKYDFCRDKRFVATKLCLSFVSTSILLSRQNMCFITTNACLLQQTHFCYDKMCVTTKMILVAAPTNDRQRVCLKLEKM